MQTKLTYEWMVEQVNKLEKAVIDQCDFCTGNTNNKKRAFPMNKEFDEQFILKASILIFRMNMMRNELIRLEFRRI